MLKLYDVTFTNDDPDFQQTTSFWAEDEAHAKEQCENAEPGCIVERVICCVAANEPYVIVSSDEGGDCFWSNEYGWTALEEATRFAYAELKSLNLPLASPVDAEWVPLRTLEPYPIHPVA